MIITTTSYCHEASTSHRGNSSYLLLHNKPPQNSANQFLMLTDSYGSGIQAEHTGNGFFLFYNVRGLGWKELKAGG